MDLQRLLSFIERHGSDIEKARASWILRGAQPGPEIVRRLAAQQNPDGGFPYRLAKGNLSTVAHTAAALWSMGDLGLLNSPTAQRAASYLLAGQKDDGGWDEDPRIAENHPPPWCIPGDERTRVYLTADAAFWLAAMGYRGYPAFPRALGFLLQRRDESGRFHGFLHSTWIAASVFTMAGEQYREVVEASLRVLMSKPLGEWRDSQIGWALHNLARAGLPADQPFVAAALQELLRRQRPDGSWSSEDGAAHDVGATLEALAVLKHYGLLPPIP